MIQQFFFYNLLTYIINVLLFGTVFTYILYIYLFKNKYQDINKNDYNYNIIKNILLSILITSFVIFFIFVFYYHFFYNNVFNYVIFNKYTILPNLRVDFYFSWFEFSVDFFGLVLLFLGYFVGVLSLLALDNRIF